MKDKTKCKIIIKAFSKHETARGAALYCDKKGLNVACDLGNEANIAYELWYELSARTLEN